VRKACETATLKLRKEHLLAEIFHIFVCPIRLSTSCRQLTLAQAQHVTNALEFGPFLSIAILQVACLLLKRRPLRFQALFRFAGGLQFTV
jgi:hypothetical protein